MFRKYLMSRIDSLQREVEFLQEAVKAHDAEDATTPGPQQPTEVVTEKKARKAPEAKVEIAETKPAKKSAKVEAESAADEDDFLNDDAADEVSGPTKEDVRKIVKEFAAKHGKDRALKLLKKFGVESIPDLKESDYSKLIELAKKHL